MPARSLRVTALAGLLAASVALGGTTADAAPPRGAGSGPAIEDPARYQPQFLCKDRLQPGVRGFRNVVLKEYPRTRSVSEVRRCSSSSTSEHQDGRAWDWGVRVWKKGERRTAKRLLNWLLATDAHGNRNAMARRLGIMYIIWDKQIWRSYTGEWGPYSCSGVTSCHQDHVHFSFGWAGARKKTSYWDGTVTSHTAPAMPVYRSLTEPFRTRVKAREGERWGSKALRGGLLYSIRVNGVFAYGSKPHQKADAVCKKTRSGAWKRDPMFSASGIWHLSPTHDTGGGCNLHNHAYVATFIPSLSDAIKFSIHDRRLGDNAGRLRVVINRLLL